MSGQDEFSQWSDWERSKLGKDVHDAAIAFRNIMTDKLEKSTLDCNAKYLVNEADKINPGDDSAIRQFLSRLQVCLKDSRLDSTIKRSLSSVSDNVILKWKKEVVEKAKGDRGEIERRWRATIPPKFVIKKEGN